MRRYPEYSEIAMAPPPRHPKPFVDGGKFAKWSFAGGRPFKCGADCKRWHAGVDVRGKGQCTAPEELEVIRSAGWTSSTRAAFARTSSGQFLVFGGFVPGTVRLGTKKVGDVLGTIEEGYGMVHFETYLGKATKNARWYVGSPPPPLLLNPLNYVEKCFGSPLSVETTQQKRNILKWFRLDVGVGKWGATDIRSLKTLQREVGVESDGVWGPRTNQAVLRKFRSGSEIKTSSSSGQSILPFVGLGVVASSLLWVVLRS